LQNTTERQPEEVAQTKGSSLGWLRTYGPDLACVLTFFAFGFLWQMSILAWQPDYLGLYEDAARYVATAVAQDHPDAFRYDSVVRCARSLSELPVMMFSLIRIAQRITGDYGSAMVSLLGVHVGVMMSGFYLLGRVLFRSRFWAIVLAVLNLAPVEAGFGTYWGITNYPLPRITFAALLPYVWAMALTKPRSSRMQLAVILSLFILVFAHPINGLPAAFAIWFGFWATLWTRDTEPDRLQQPTPSASKTRQIIKILALGGVFLVGSLWMMKPLLQQALIKQTDVVQDAGVYGLMGTYGVGNGRWLEFPLAMVQTGTVFVFLSAVAGWVILWRKNRLLAKTILFWVAGLVFTSWCIPLLIKLALDQKSMVSFHLELMRAIRQLIGIAILLSVWGLAMLDRQKHARRYVQTALLLLAVWFCANDGGKLFGLPLKSKRQLQNYSAIAQGLAPRRELIRALRTQTPTDALVLPFEFDPMLIRYGAIRPVAYSERDSLLLAVSGRDVLLWQKNNIEAEKEIKAMPWSDEKMKRICNWARELHADYVVFSAPEAVENEGFTKIWKNDDYQIFHVTPTK